MNNVERNIINVITAPSSYDMFNRFLKFPIVRMAYLIKIIY